MLYVIGLPIGNIQDITLRAIEILQTVDLILCEDTRQFKKYQNKFNISTPLGSYEDFSEREQSEIIANLMKKQKKKIALVSDAGTPMISDPGYHLLQQCYLNNIKVIPVPGPSAVITAASVCPFNDGVFQFSGFYESKKHRSLIESSERDLIFFESPKRIKNTLKDLFSILKERRVFVAKEMTKEYEKFYLFTNEEDINNQIRIEDLVELGEFVFIVEKNKNTQVVISYEEIWKNFSHIHIKDLAKIIAYFTNLSRTSVYENLIKTKEKREENL